VKRPLKNLLVSIGAGYHPAVRSLHGMVREMSDSRILIFQLEKTSAIGEDLRVDCSVSYKDFPGAFKLFEEWILKNRFELIGISFMSHHRDIFVEMTRIIRKALPGCKIIAGGVHAWLIDPDRTIEHCDYVCAGEGEELYKNLLESLSGPETGRPLRLPGLMEKYDGNVIRTPVKEYMPIDDLPVPTMGSEYIHYLYSKGDIITFKQEDPQLSNTFSCVHIGRGCPFKCTYCINSLFPERRKVRVRSVNKVISEIKRLLGFRKFEAFIFMDEIFPLQASWLEEFAAAYKKEVGVPFVITLYPGMLTYEKTKLLKEAGLKEVSIGIQSGSENIRKNVYERSGTNSRILEENEMLSKLGIMTYYDFIIKNPFEKEADYRDSLELVSSLKRPFYLKFHTLAYYPRHPITDMALGHKLIDEGDISATIGYLDVNTPHKVAIVDHYPVERNLLFWNAKLRKEMSCGHTDSSYWLLASYYGYWYMPKFILEAVKRQYLKGGRRALNILSSIVQFTLVIRNNIFSKKVNIAVCMYKQRGPVFVMDEIRMKILRSIKQGRYGKKTNC